MGKDKKQNYVLDRIDPFTDEPNPTKDDFNSLFKKISIELEKIQANQKKKKMSYSVSPSSQVLIKNISEEAGATQGSVVDLAPFLFAAIIRDSLKRRSEKINILESLVKQITGSLQGMVINAPHLEGYFDKVKEITNEILEMEKSAIKNKNFSGVNPENHPALPNINSKGTKPAYYKEVEALIGEDDQLKNLFNNVFDDTTQD